MDFTLPDTSKPCARKCANSPKIRPMSWWDEAKTYPMAVIKQLGEMGMLGVIFPKNTAARAWATSSTPWWSRNSAGSAAA